MATHSVRLNPGTGGDLIRVIDRGSLGKTQVVILDQMEALGYEQVTALSSAKALTVPTGTLLALITCSGQPVRWRDDGTNPTASVGMPLAVGATLQYDSIDIAAARFIETATSATLDVSYYGFS